MGEPEDITEYSNKKRASSPSSSSSSSPSFSDEELQYLEHAPPIWSTNYPKNNNKRLSKQFSICEIHRNNVWERRRLQFLQQDRRKNNVNNNNNKNNNNNNNHNISHDDLTDEDLNELKGCIELGFGFNEENGQKLCNTIPALDLYFAVNRQFATSPITSPATSSTSSLGGRSCSSGSPKSDSDSLKIFSPGDDPQHVKTKLRHWAQAVACSVMQSSLRGEMEMERERE